MPNPKVFFDMTIGGATVGRIIMEARCGRATGARRRVRGAR